MLIKLFDKRWKKTKSLGKYMRVEQMVNNTISIKSCSVSCFLNLAYQTCTHIVPFNIFWVRKTLLPMIKTHWYDNWRIMHQRYESRLSWSWLTTSSGHTYLTNMIGSLAEWYIWRRARARATIYSPLFMYKIN